MQKIQDFISAGLLTDQAWEQALESGFESVVTDKSPADRLHEAIRLGMEEEMAEIDTIVTNPEPPTFSNTIEALERTGERLERATTLMYNLLSAETSDSLDSLANETAPLLSEHANNIMLNPALFERVRTVYHHAPTTLTGEEKMLLEKTYEGFERAGATLSEASKKEFREITGSLSVETLRFSQNLLKDTNAFFLHLTDETRLEGLPAIHREAAAEEAAQRKLDGWVFTLQAPSFVPFMMYVRDRSLRETLYRAYHTRCKHGDEADNSETVRRIVNLRLRLARLLGYPNYAVYALKRRMAETPEKVNELLDNLIDRYAEKARGEVDEVERYAREQEGENFRLQPWDFAYYSRALKDARYSYDPDLLRPYLELSRVKSGVFALATRLYGIRFEEAEDVPTYHEDVTAYRVFDKDGSYLSLLYLDFFPRTGKQGGAWMTSYREEYQRNGETGTVNARNSVRPVVSVTTNFTKPTADKPSLLTLGEVETFLHEFGHALHGIFAMTRYASLSGTAVFWDFVELPSQIMENYVPEPDFLHTFARHYETNEPIPEEYIDRLRRSRRFQAAYACMRQVSFGLLDMAYYSRDKELDEDIKTFEEAAWKRAKLLPDVAEACMTVQFGHIMSGGYAAGYYSYKWAEVLDADAFARFREQGIFDSATADSFRQTILSRGGTVHPARLYEAFRGRPATIDALLRRDGLIE